MDNCGSLAAPPSERNRVFEVIDYYVLQVNHHGVRGEKEILKTRRRGCGMWVYALSFRECSTSESEFPRTHIAATENTHSGNLVNRGTVPL